MGLCMSAEGGGRRRLGAYDGGAAPGPPAYMTGLDRVDQGIRKYRACQHRAGACSRARAPLIDCRSTGSELKCQYRWGWLLMLRAPLSPKSKSLTLVQNVVITCMSGTKSFRNCRHESWPATSTVSHLWSTLMARTSCL